MASANPEDYTSRGRIITPLKDRFDVQIRTHYPREIKDEIAIMEQEVAHMTFKPRKSTEISPSSGVSVRVTINNYESLISNAEKRALRLREGEVVPRVSDFHAMLASTGGKIEMEYVGEERKEDDL